MKSPHSIFSSNRRRLPVDHCLSDNVSRYLHCCFEHYKGLRALDARRITRGARKAIFANVHYAWNTQNQWVDSFCIWTYALNICTLIRCRFACCYCPCKIDIQEILQSLVNISYTHVCVNKEEHFWVHCGSEILRVNSVIPFTFSAAQRQHKSMVWNPCWEPCACYFCGCWYCAPDGCDFSSFLKVTYALLQQLLVQTSYSEWARCASKHHLSHKLKI